MAILVTGGAGYIGSHTVLSLLERGEDVVVLDNLSNSSAESLQRVEKLSGKAAEFHQGDVQDAECLQRIFGAHEITAVIHFAGLKAVGSQRASRWSIIRITLPARWCCWMLCVVPACTTLSLALLPLSMVPIRRYLM